MVVNIAGANCAADNQEITVKGDRKEAELKIRRGLVLQLTSVARHPLETLRTNSSFIGQIDRSRKAMALRPRITPGVPLSVISKELVAYGLSLMFIICFVNNYDSNPTT